ncbi:MAG: hypothetical protein WCK53_06765 [Methanomicrobiales archaeon]
MNTHYANIAGPAAYPDSPGAAALTFPDIHSGKQVVQFSGIRSSGQYCRPTEFSRIGQTVTAVRKYRGRSAVHGMCP